MKTALFKNILVVVALLVVMAFVSFIGTILFPSQSSISEKDFHILLTQRINDAIEAGIEGPLQLSKAMAKSSFILEVLKNEENYTEEEAISIMQKWLSNIKETGDYPSAFLISEKTKRYYTADGLNKIIDPQNDSHDIWYSNFMTTDSPLTLDVDIDQTNKNIWTIFLNVKIYDGDKILGVCGLGIKMSKMQKILENYESQYNIRINLVDYDGLVQVDTDNINIENSYRSSQFFSEDDEILYTVRRKGFAASCYISELNWYLLVKNSDEHKHTTSINPKFVVLEIISLFILLALAIIYNIRVEKKNKKNSKKLPVDPLTGLNNRNYFKETYGEKGVFNTTRYKSLAVFDIDSFKEANDSLNGDKILVAITEKAKELLGSGSEIFRWGGDEFTVLMEEPINSAYELCRKFCKEIENEGQITISIGITEVHLSDSVKKNYYRAAQGCYLVKELGGNGVKRF
ncbi:MAG: sensor domain-containing diguanylate cyclase [Treponema sp.]|nr:sensor domain-containing diguanylate cyclase [Treponema sp.]